MRTRYEIAASPEFGWIPEFHASLVADQLKKEAEKREVHADHAARVASFAEPRGVPDPRPEDPPEVNVTVLPPAGEDTPRMVFSPKRQWGKKAQKPFAGAMPKPKADPVPAPVKPEVVPVVVKQADVIPITRPKRKPAVPKVPDNTPKPKRTRRIVKPRVCSLCLQSGHNRQRCPTVVTPKEKRVYPAHRTYVCKRCGKEGHQTRTCVKRHEDARRLIGDT